MSENGDDNDPTVESLRLRAAEFDERIRARNRREVVVASSLVPIFAVAAYWLAASPVSVIGLVLLSLGCASVAAAIHRGGTGPTSAVQAPTETFLQQSAAELRHQARILRTSPLWYIGPLLPGLLLILGDSVAAADPARQLLVAGTIGAPVCLTLGAVAWLNLLVARRLILEAEATEALIRR